jgi:hypothetical protein
LAGRIGLFVYVAAVADVEDSDALAAVVDRVDDLVITQPDSIKVAIIQFLTAKRTRMGFEGIKFGKNTIPKSFGQLLELTLGACCYIDAIF